MSLLEEPCFRKPEGRLVWDALKEGLKPREAATRLGLSGDKVSNYIKYWRAKGFHIPHYVEMKSATPGSRMIITIPRSAVMALMRSAARRKISAEALVTKLVTTVVDERLIDGVLDDQG